jgi:hypothetical protein
LSWTHHSYAHHVGQVTGEPVNFQLVIRAVCDSRGQHYAACAPI